MVSYLANDELLQAVANSASVLGLLISGIGLGFTVAAVLGIRAIRRRFRTTARLPQLHDDLREQMSQINRQLSSNDLESTAASFARCRATMESILDVASGPSYRAAKRAKGSLMRKGLRGRQMERADANQAYVQLAEVEEALKNLLEDNKWR